ncbi:TolC family protein [Thermaurantiacus sp.]
MRRRLAGLRPALALAALWLVLTAPLFAQPLLLAEVLESSRQHAPQVLEAMARVRAAEARRTEAEGAFDTVVTGTAETRLSGTYDGRLLGTTVTRPFLRRGGQIYGGYRVSGGDFPVYEDESFTNQGGELKVGALFALLRDRAIDDRRFGLFLADTAVALAETETLLTAIAIQRRAIDAWLAWVAAGQRLRVYRELLAIAEERQDGFRRQVREGARPAIIVTENEQAILRRRALVVDSERALEAAAVRLSIYWRDADGRPQVPAEARLPQALPPPLPIGNSSTDARTRQALGTRPDVKAIDLRLAQASEQLRLNENLRKPRVDLKVEASRDLGAEGLGGPSRSGTETKVGLAFSLPLEQRTASGRIAATRAEIQAFALRRRQLEEEISVTLDALDADVRASRRLVELAAREREAALELARAERRRFQLGASDLFLTTVREEAAADAEVRAIDARLRQAAAHADLAAALADLSALGLSPPPSGSTVRN